MTFLAEQVERGTGLLIQASAELEHWTGLWAGKEELLTWHLCEMIYDYKYVEMHLSECLDCQDRPSLLAWLTRHSDKIQVSMVLHWRGHMDALRERMAICRVVHAQGQARRSAEGAQEEASSLVSAESVAMAGIDALRVALPAFTARLVEEDLVEPGLARSMLDFVADLRALHERLLKILPMRRFESLAPALLEYCDEVDKMLIRWDAYATRLDSWVESHNPDPDATEDDTRDT
jgi:hypothetical protein